MVQKRIYLQELLNYGLLLIKKYYLFIHLRANLTDSFMKMVITELELELREIKYLTHDLSLQPDAALIEVAKRRIKEMQSHLNELLQQVDSLPVEEKLPEEEQEEILPDSIKDENKQAQEVYIENILNSIQAELPSVTENKSNNSTEDIIETLAQQIEPKVNLKEAFTLNDIFRFSRELFDGDTEYMNHALEQMAQMENYEFVCSFLASKVKVASPEENVTLSEFEKIIKKYFT
jgi:hypothetical protein